MVTARSAITLPGSWRRRRLHIGASASERASVSPERSAISASRRLPAWVASPLPSAVTFNAGRHLVAFTWYVPSCLGPWRLDNPIFPGQEGFFADLPPLHSTVNERCGLRAQGVVGSQREPIPKEFHEHWALPFENTPQTDRQTEGCSYKPCDQGKRPVSSEAPQVSHHGTARSSADVVGDHRPEGRRSPTQKGAGRCPVSLSAR